MSQPMKNRALHTLTTELAKAIDSVKEAANSLRGVFDPSAYRDKLSKALIEMQQISVRVLASGHASGLAQIGDIASTFEEFGDQRRGKAADEILWDVISQHYPVLGSWNINLSSLSEGLQIRLFEQMISQESNPYGVIIKQLQRLSKSAFMDGVTTAIRLTHFDEVDVRPDFYKTLLLMKAHVVNPEFMPAAVEHVAAHRDLYLGYFEQVTRVAALQEAMAPIGGYEDPEKLVARRRRLILEAVGYDEAGIQKMFDSGSAQEVVPDTMAFLKMKNALALPPAFLHMLYEETGDYVLIEMGVHSLSHPSGPKPYAHLEEMGIVRPPEWHKAAQEGSELDKAFFLYEHAIHTPGIELAPYKLTNPGFVYKNEALIDRAIQILANTPIKDPECRRKGQVMFDAMVHNMESGAAISKLKDKLESCDLPAIFYGKHGKLKVAKLENELGM